MPALGLSAAIRKASDLGQRALSLAFTTPRLVTPQARYPTRPCDSILILQKGENASTDYYLRPRLPADLPVEIVDLDRPVPSSVLKRQASLVIVCRYISAEWLAELGRSSQAISRVAFFADDDLPGMMSDRSLPWAVRGKVARHYGRHAAGLSAVTSEVWLSTEALAARYPDARAIVLAPVPEADYRLPEADAPPLVVYHSTDVHGHERQFVLEVANHLAALAPEVRLEMTGDASLRGRAGPNVRIVEQTSWPRYREEQSVRSVAISLAPLLPSAVNAARAPVKAFDAARLGAAGLYADVEPYRSFVRNGEDGLLLPMHPEAWARAIGELISDPESRLRLAESAHQRMARLRREAGGLPPAHAP
jgi:hypothetical protein